MLSASWPAGCGFSRIRTSCAAAFTSALRGACVQQRRDLADIRLGQHVGLREDQPVDRVGRRGVPVDEVINDIGVGPERQHGRDRAHRQALCWGQPGSRRELVQVLCRVRVKPPAG